MSLEIKSVKAYREYMSLNSLHCVYSFIRLAYVLFIIERILFLGGDQEIR